MLAHEFIFAFIFSIFFDVRERGIHVRENEYIKILVKRFVDVRLKTRESVHQFKKHNIIMKVLESTLKRHFSLVSFLKLNLVKRVSNIEFDEHLCFEKSIHACVDQRKRMFILDCYRI